MNQKTVSEHRQASLETRKKKGQSIRSEMASPIRPVIIPGNLISRFRGIAIQDFEEISKQSQEPIKKFLCGWLVGTNDDDKKERIISTLILPEQNVARTKDGLVMNEKLKTWCKNSEMKHLGWINFFPYKGVGHKNPHFCDQIVAQGKTCAPFIIIVYMKGQHSMELGVDDVNQAISDPKSKVVVMEASLSNTNMAAQLIDPGHPNLQFPTITSNLKVSTAESLEVKGKIPDNTEEDIHEDEDEEGMFKEKLEEGETRVCLGCGYYCVDIFALDCGHELLCNDCSNHSVLKKKCCICKKGILDRIKRKKAGPTEAEQITCDICEQIFDFHEIRAHRQTVHSASGNIEIYVSGTEDHEESSSLTNTSMETIDPLLSCERAEDSHEGAPVNEHAGPPFDNLKGNLIQPTSLDTENNNKDMSTANRLLTPIYSSLPVPSLPTELEDLPKCKHKLNPSPANYTMTPGVFATEDFYKLLEKESLHLNLPDWVASKIEIPDWIFPSHDTPFKCKIRTCNSYGELEVIHDGIFVPTNKDEFECIICHKRTSNVDSPKQVNWTYAHKITTNKGRWLCDGHGGFRHTRSIDTLKKLEEHFLRDLYWETSFPEIKYCIKCTAPLVSEAHTIVHRANCGFTAGFIGSIGPQCPYCSRWTGCDLFTRIHLVASHTNKLLEHSPSTETVVPIRMITEKSEIPGPGSRGRITRSFSQNPQLGRQTQKNGGEILKYKCEVCHQMFGQEEAKERHVRKNHLPKSMGKNLLLDEVMHYSESTSSLKKPRRMIKRELIPKMARTPPVKLRKLVKKTSATRNGQEDQPSEIIQEGLEKDEPERNRIVIKREGNNRVTDAFNFPPLKSGRYYCDSCMSTNGFTWDQLQRHKPICRLRLSDGITRCPECDLTCTNTEELTIHILNTHERIKCKFYGCDRLFFTMAMEKQHRKSFHKKLLPMAVETVHQSVTQGMAQSELDAIPQHKRKEKPICPFPPEVGSDKDACPKFEESSEFYQHILKRHVEVICDLCKGNYASQDAGFVHWDRKHTNKFVQKCERCKNSYKNRSWIIHHWRYRCRPVVFECKLGECNEWNEKKQWDGKRLTKNQWVSHMKQHHGIRKPDHINAVTYDAETQKQVVPLSNPEVELEYKVKVGRTTRKIKGGKESKPTHKKQDPSTQRKKDLTLGRKIVKKAKPFAIQSMKKVASVTPNTRTRGKVSTPKSTATMTVSPSPAPQPNPEEQKCNRCWMMAEFKCPNLSCIEMKRQYLCAKCDRACHLGVTTMDHIRVPWP